MASKPLFSIIIPTRNRALLLRNALQSVRNQTFGDYEIIVCDNCSDDETSQVAKAYDVQYVRPPEVLSLPRNWEFALSQAQGEYVTFLSDDDAFSPSLLNRVSQHLDHELIAWNFCDYFYPDFHQKERRNSLFTRYFSGETQVVSADATLEYTFATFSLYRFPQLTNAIYKRSLIERMRRKVSNLFPIVSADVFSGVLALSLLDDYLFLDYPFTVYGRHEQSITAMIIQGREHDELHQLPYVPLKFNSITNLLSNALLTARHQIPELQTIPFPWELYYYGTLQDLQHYKRDGVNISEWLKQWSEVAPDNLKEQSSDNGNRNAGRLRDALSFLEVKLRPHVKKARTLVIKGEDAEFSNLSECVNKIDAIFSSGFMEAKIGRYHSTAAWR